MSMSPLGLCSPSSPLLLGEHKEASGRAVPQGAARGPAGQVEERTRLTAQSCESVVDALV